MRLPSSGAQIACDRMSETEKPFTVNDRRHFRPDGRVRENSEPETPAVSEEPESTGESGPAPKAGEPLARADAAERERRPEASSSSPDPESSSGSPGGPANFSQFLLSLGAQASMFLSGQGLPEDTDPKAALEGARSVISILEMLRDKTDGRRTAQEDEVIEGLLFELRMAFVEKSRAGGS